jgi:hypothetical protein
MLKLIFLSVLIVYMYSKNIHNINDVFEQFVSTFNTVPIITKCNKSNILEFQFKTHEKNIVIFCCDPNDINVITFKEVKELCIQNKVEWKNQSYTGFITSLKIISLMNYVDELNLLKNNVMKLIRSLNLSIICVNVVSKKSNLK